MCHESELNHTGVPLLLAIGDGCTEVDAPICFLSDDSLGETPASLKQNALGDTCIVELVDTIEMILVNGWFGGRAESDFPKTFGTRV
jgi:hypothetical protein